MENIAPTRVIRRMRRAANALSMVAYGRRHNLKMDRRRIFELGGWVDQVTCLV